MSKKKIVLSPKTEVVMIEFGDKIKKARLKCKLSAEIVAEKSNISRPTLTAIEKGAPTVSIGSYFLVLQTLGLEKEFVSTYNKGLVANN